MILYILHGTDSDITKYADKLIENGEYVINYGDTESVLQIRDEVLYHNHKKIYAFYIGKSQNWAKFLKISIMNYLDERFIYSLSVLSKHTETQYPEDIEIKTLKV